MPARWGRRIWRGPPRCLLAKPSGRTAGGRPSDRKREDAQLAAEINAVHEDSKGRYGVPRVRAQGHRHSRQRVARLMRAAGLRGRAAKRWKETTIPDPAAAARADRICRDSRLAALLPGLTAREVMSMATGKVKWYDADKRVGFLTCDDGGEVGSTFIFLVVSQAKVVIYLDDESDQ